MKNDSLESRIALMSAAYNRLRRVANILTEKAEELEVIAGDVDLLKDYVVSRQWLDDFESDERGEIGPGVDRSVLSEDGLYNRRPRRPYAHFRKATGAFRRRSEAG